MHYTCLLSRELALKNSNWSFTEHSEPYYASHEPLCLMPSRSPSSACALLELSQASTGILQIFSLLTCVKLQSSPVGHSWFALQLLAGKGVLCDLNSHTLQQFISVLISALVQSSWRLLCITLHLCLTASQLRVL